MSQFMSTVTSENSAVTVSTDYYEELVRESERLDIVKDYVRNTTYIDKEKLSIILGINLDAVESEKRG